MEEILSKGVLPGRDFVHAPFGVYKQIFEFAKSNVSLYCNSHNCFYMYHYQASSWGICTVLTADTATTSNRNQSTLQKIY